MLPDTLFPQDIEIRINLIIRGRLSLLDAHY